MKRYWWETLAKILDMRLPNISINIPILYCSICSLVNILFNPSKTTSSCMCGAYNWKQLAFLLVHFFSGTIGAQLEWLFIHKHTYAHWQSCSFNRKSTSRHDTTYQLRSKRSQTEIFCLGAIQLSSLLLLIISINLSFNILLQSLNTNGINLEEVIWFYWWKKAEKPKEIFGAADTIITVTCNFNSSEWKQMLKNAIICFCRMAVIWLNPSLFAHVKHYSRYKHIFIDVQYT